MSRAPRIRTAATALALLLAVYAPAFIVTSWLRPVLPVAIALIIGVSLCLALGIIYWFVQPGNNLTTFGFALPDFRWVVFAFACAIPPALGAAWLAAALPSPSPFNVGSFGHLQQVLYFLVAAPVQEEVIFRGLVQSFLQERWSETRISHRLEVAPAVLFTAALFAAVHLSAGLPTVVGGFVLSVLAGELRRRSGSLLPAVVVHSLFNAASMLLPSP